MHLLSESSTSELPCASNGRPSEKKINNDHESSEFLDGEENDNSMVESETRATNSPAAGEITIEPSEPIVQTGSTAASTSSDVAIVGNMMKPNEVTVEDGFAMTVVQVDTYETKSGLYFFSVKLILDSTFISYNYYKLMFKYFTDFEAIVLASLNTITTQIQTLRTSVESLEKKQNDTIDYLKDTRVIQNFNSTIDFYKKYDLVCLVQSGPFQIQARE